MIYVMGIDGGGSSVRVVIASHDLTILGQSEGPSANPAVVGADTAAQTIHRAMRAALESAHLAENQIGAVGIGVAGAAASHSAGWLRSVVEGVLPQARIVPSADYEIALVGALGQRDGVLVLAGTGSLAYGINAAGQTALVGGWGYLLDDAGSGFWIGIRGLEAVARAADGRGPETTVTSTLLNALNLHNPMDLIAWLYYSTTSRNRAVAGLAPLVIEQAAGGDQVASAVVVSAVDELVLVVRTVTRRLNMTMPAFAFAGGLLTHENFLSWKLCAALGLESIPAALHPPVIGAALLALWSGNMNSKD